MQLFFGPNASPGSNNANYDNEEFNRLFRASATMQASPLRTAMYRNMNRIVIDDCATISGISRKLVLLWRREHALLPDRSFVGGYFFRFADVSPASSAQDGTE
jgi:oligopeptide transport system substrate-binding protein